MCYGRVDLALIIDSNIATMLMRLEVVLYLFKKNTHLNLSTRKADNTVFVSRMRTWLK